MIQSALAMITRLFTGATPLWKGCQPEIRPRIYFANHTSHFDALVLWASLPGEVRSLTRPVAARDYWEEGFFRNYIASNIFNAILIERKRPTRSNNPIETMLNAIGEQGSLIVFPEGGRFSGPDPVEFKSGLFHLAKKRPDIELVPVLLDNLNRILPKGEMLPLPLICSVVYGAPMHLEPGEPKKVFLARARQAVMDLREPSHGSHSS